MYEAHFGLRQRPFRPTLDGESWYPATTHEHALARLLRGIADEEALLVLTGEPGIGKTLLSHRLLERLGPDAVTAFVTNSHVGDRAGLLQAILFELSLPYEGRSQQEMRLALTEFLLANYGAGRRALVVFDEAQHLTPDLLEELRLLGNLESAKGRAVHVLLIGQLALQQTLRKPELAAVRQRAVRADLDPLDIHESADYVVHRLRAAGGRPEAVVTDEALTLLARSCQGVPRLLNQAAHAALTLAFQAGAEAVDAEAALEALAVVGLEANETAGAVSDETATGEAVIDFAEMEKDGGPGRQVLPRVRRPA